MAVFVSLALATLLSEDLTSIGAGLLIQRGEIGIATGVFACTLGIFVGDLGLWAVGRVMGRAALASPRMARRLRHGRMEELRRWLDRHAAGAIVGSRFLPGTRLPLYVLAGVLELPAAVFVKWSLLAVALWTPTVVLFTATLSDAFVPRLASVAGLGWTPRLLVAALVLLLLHAGRSLASASRRARLAARIARWSRWEFWPMWLFYAPVTIWVAVLALRHRGLGTVTAANPGMPDGGTLGESKFDILSRLPADSVIPSVLIRPGSAREREAALEQHVASAGWSLPLVLKPDVGQRGRGVKLARGWDDVRAYFSRVSTAVVAQPFHPGPFEAGVFYYRMPGDARGRIFSITDKQFPVVVGNGVSTLEQLIWSHPRCRLQAGTFLARLDDRLGQVPDRGAPVPLGIAGNHAQGATFRDGRHLITPALERRVDGIARAFGGFFVGRFDIRYRDIEAFKAGTDLAIVELNGATAESTIIYDPATSLLDAYRHLFEQWSIVFAIGAANRAAGAPVSSARRLVELVRAHAAAEDVFVVSD